MKVVINVCYGGFGLSEKAYKAMGIPWDGYGYQFGDDSKRSDERLIKVVEELGEEANGFAAKLKIVELPDGIGFEIDDYDGMESIHEVHRSWR